MRTHRRVLGRGGTGSDPSSLKAAKQGSEGGSREASEEAAATVLVGDEGAGPGWRGGGCGVSDSGSTLQVEPTGKDWMWEERETGT